MEFLLVGELGVAGILLRNQLANVLVHWAAPVEEIAHVLDRVKETHVLGQLAFDVYFIRRLPILPPPCCLFPVQTVDQSCFLYNLLALEATLLKEPVSQVIVFLEREVDFGSKVHLCVVGDVFDRLGFGQLVANHDPVAVLKDRLSLSLNVVRVTLYFLDSPPGFAHSVVVVVGLGKQYVVCIDSVTLQVGNLLESVIQDGITGIIDIRYFFGIPFQLQHA